MMNADEQNKKVQQPHHQELEIIRESRFDLNSSSSPPQFGD
jgi:hypothetical protein